MKYHDNNTVASDPVGIDLDISKLKYLFPELCSPLQMIKYRLRKYGYKSRIEKLAEHIKCGDSMGAIVVKTSPLLIAAQNGDIDCIVMLRFESKIQGRYKFKVKDRLLCVNTFGRSSQVQEDLIPGPNYTGMWQIVHPIVAELVSSSTESIEKRKSEIGNEGYDYIWKLATQYLKEKPGVYRNGKPFLAAIPGKTESS